MSRQVLCALLGFCAVTLSAVSSFASEHDSNRDSDLIKEELAVYEALLENKYIFEKTKLLVLQPQVYTGRSKEGMEAYKREIKQKLPEMSDEVIEDFVRKVYLPHILNDQLKLKVKWVLLDKATLRSVFKLKEGQGITWKQFYAEYPESSGSISLSRVGFDRSRTVAFVDVFHGYGEVGASADYYLLRKQNEKWIVEKNVNHGGA